MQQITTIDIPTLEIDSNTSSKLLVRIPIIIEKLALGLSVDEIARDLGIHRSNVYRTLRKVDFAPVVDLCIERTIDNTEKLDDPDRRAWHYGRLIQTLHSKKVIAEVTRTDHLITEDRKTLRVALDHLDPDTVLKLNEALKKAEGIDAEYTVKSAEP